MDFLKQCIVLLFVITCTHCKVAQVAVVPPFTIIKTTSTHWFGGLPGVEGDLITITYTAKRAVDFDSIQYKGRTVSISKYQEKGIKTLVGNFKTVVATNGLLQQATRTLPKEEKGLLLYYRIKNQVHTFEIPIVLEQHPIFHQ